MGEVKPYEDEVHDAKMLVMETSLSGELVRLANELRGLAEADYHTRDFTLQALQKALAEIIAAFPRYRTYLPHGQDEAKTIVREAVGAAKRRNPATEKSVYDFIERCLLDEREGDLEPAREAIVGRFQQFTAPVTAKGVEDTTFYRYLPFRRAQRGRRRTRPLFYRTARLSRPRPLPRLPLSRELAGNRHPRPQTR